MNKDEVLRVAGEPVAYMRHWLPHAATIGKTLSFHGKTPRKGSAVSSGRDYEGEYS